MEKLLLLMVMLATCCAEPQDLSGKVFVFPRDSATDHVKLLTTQTKFSSVTSCFRFQTDLTRNYVLLSLATTTFSNDFVLFKPSAANIIRVHARDGGADFLALPFATNTWHSMCVTWRSDNGLSQIWMDGKATIRRFIKIGAISGAPITILGQEQDSYGGGFDSGQSFVGMITKFHMWDYVLPTAEIKRYMSNMHFTAGNVFNWRGLEYDITGKIFVEEESEVM